LREEGREERGEGRDLIDSTRLDGDGIMVGQQGLALCADGVTQVFHHVLTHCCPRRPVPIEHPCSTLGSYLPGLGGSAVRGSGAWRGGVERKEAGGVRCIIKRGCRIRP